MAKSSMLSADEQNNSDAVMYSLSAILAANAGRESILQKALHDIVAHVKLNKPGTIEYYVAQDTSDPTVFTAYERYINQEAMDAHNNSAECAEFYRIINPILREKVILVKPASRWQNRLRKAVRSFF